MLFSVIISSFNRAEKLREALSSLEKMQVPPDVTWELIVVDNNSTDHTRDVVEDFRRKQTLPLVHLQELRQGKPIALNTALREAKGEVIAFTDDDCILSTDWIAAMARNLAADPSLAGIGGRVELFDKQDHPTTTRAHAERTLFSSPGQLFSLIIGCNMAFTRKIFDEIGEFDPYVGPGARIGSGNDVDILYRAYKKGFKIVYCPDVVVYHKHGRRTDADIHTVNRRYTIGRGAFYCKYILKGDLNILKMAYWEIVPLARRAIKGLFTRYSVRDSTGQLSALLRGIMSRLKITISGSTM